MRGIRVRALIFAPLTPPRSYIYIKARKKLTWLAPGRPCPLCCGGFWCHSSWLVDNRTDCGTEDELHKARQWGAVCFCRRSVATVPPVGGVVSCDVSRSIAAGRRTPEAQTRRISQADSREVGKRLLSEHLGSTVDSAAALRWFEFADSLEFLWVGRHHPAEVLVGQLAAWQPAGGEEAQSEHEPFQRYRSLKYERNWLHDVMAKE